jgi:hypothetical protein
MTEPKLPTGDPGGVTAPGRPFVPEQATAPAEEIVSPTEEVTAASAEAGEEQPHHRLRRHRPRRQTAFRRWRKTRPFWGGLFTMLGGLEIAALTAASYELLFVSRSVGFAIAVGATITVFGLTMWLSPVLSKLLGLLTLVAALLSFVTSNLGGFLLGMLLAILGGGLCFAWEPGNAPVGRQPVAEAETGEPTAEHRAAVPGQRAPQLAEGFEPLDHFLEG